MDVSAYRGCGSARHMMPANAPKNSQPTMRSTPFARPTLACLAGGPREWKNCSHMEILAMVPYIFYIESSTTCSRSYTTVVERSSCLFDSISMFIELDLHPIDQPVCLPASGAEGRGGGSAGTVRPVPTAQAAWAALAPAGRPAGRGPLARPFRNLTAYL